MKWIFGAAGTIYALGFFGTWLLHVVALPMVSSGLALVRAAVWPYFWITGRPEGVPDNLMG